MAATILTFKGDLQRFAEKIDGGIAIVVQKICSDLYARIIANTPAHRHPVDTGRARSGWTLTIGSPDSFQPAPVSREILDARARVECRGGKPGEIIPPPEAPDVSAIDGKQAVYILNNLPYIQALENGHSKQAPRGFVGLSLREVEAELESFETLNP